MIYQALFRFKDEVVIGRPLSVRHEGESFDAKFQASVRIEFYAYKQNNII